MVLGLVLGALAAAEANLPLLQADWRRQALLRGRAWSRVRARRRVRVVMVRLYYETERLRLSCDD